MNENDTPFRRAVHMILHGVINREDKYVLDKKFIRWGKVESDLWDLEHFVTQQVDKPDSEYGPDFFTCSKCGKKHRTMTPAMTCCQ